MFSPILPNPLPSHPRLFANSDKFAALRSQIKSDAVSARLFAALSIAADQLLEQVPVEYEMIGKRLLAVSRLCLKRVSTLAMVAAITGEQRYVEKACQEMRAAASFANWNPSHYLDTAELTLALAIGYDWLYDRLSAEDRSVISTAIRDKGLRPSFDSPKQYLGWITGENNWNQVCHAGLAAGAIAVAELEPTMAEDILARAIANLPRAAESYAPDGSYVEGPMYWDYGTSFHVILIAALESLCGSTFGMDAFPGFLGSAEYIDQVTAPSGNYFNYADAEERRSLSVPKFWFSGHLHRADLVRFEIEHLESELHRFETTASTTDTFRLLPMALLWWDPTLQTNANEAPLHWMARGGNPVVVHRSAWDAPRATFVGIKGGTASSPHGHMDAGSFVLEADGVRWAVDLGMQDYETLEKVGLNLWDAKQEGTRWTVFRLGPDSHNILRFNGEAQSVSGTADIVRFQSSGSQPHSVVDLTSTYPSPTRAAARGVALLRDRSILLQDEWTAGDAPVEVTWQMLTHAEVIPGEQEITLHQDGKTLRLCVLAPEAVKIEVRDVSQPLRSYDAENPGARQIILRTTTSTGGSGMVRVLFIPNGSECIQPPFLPLLEWSTPLSA